MKYVIVIGGVVSGFGKGVMVSSIGVVFKVCGLWVILIKIGMCIVGSWLFLIELCCKIRFWCRV